MARYTFTCEHFDYNDFTGDEQNVAAKHTTEFRADTLETMLENFELFRFFFPGFEFFVHAFQKGFHFFPTSQERTVPQV